jgi:diadenosine tetraphosphatase ApaH/serine/threonine PP2A family protein phosphatase
MRAILSDIHGNLEALEAVLQDAETQGAKEIYCLGDLVGYGPNPWECVERALSWDLVLLGNHDHAVLHGANGFGLYAGQCIDWARETVKSRPNGKELVTYLTDLYPSWAHNNVGYVHGSPRNPLHEYVFPECVFNTKKMQAVFEMMQESLCFCGHTHIPGIFVRAPAESWQFTPPAWRDNVYVPDGSRVLCNVGSVGQPRDGDPRACYVLYDEKEIRFRRVDYDIQKTIQRIAAIAEIDNFEGERLLEGR